MRCQSCDKNLNDWESTKKNNITNEYEDLCTKCLDIVQQTSIVDEHDFIVYEQEDNVVKERPTNFDYYEGDWDNYD